MLDLTDKKFGMLKVLKPSNPVYGKSGRKRLTWECLCDCGNLAVVTASNLKHSTTSCGCTKKSGNHRRTHGQKDSRIYKIWSSMKSRCTNKKLKAYKYYGGKGIEVCEEWQTFTKFRDWAFSNGYSEDLTIDRINNEKDYRPNNCRFVTRSVQSANRKKQSDKSSKYIGVHFHKASKKYASSVSFEGKTKNFGLFNSEKEAALARDSFIKQNNLPNTLNEI